MLFYESPFAVDHALTTSTRLKWHVLGGWVHVRMRIFCSTRVSRVFQNHPILGSYNINAIAEVIEILLLCSKRLKLDMASFNFSVDSPRVQYNAQRNTLLATYEYQTTKVRQTSSGQLKVTPVSQNLTFKTDCKVPRVGCMLVGWGGNNGSTITASVLANKKKLEWMTKDGVQVCL